MGKVTAKLMRDKKEARKMGDGGAGIDGGGGYGEMNEAGNIVGVDPAYATGEVMAMSADAPGNVPGQTGLEGSNLPGNISITNEPESPGGASVQETPTPKAWEANIEKPSEAGAKIEGKAISRKKRRRSLLTEEEGGILGTSPVYRRSILGR